MVPRRLRAPSENGGILAEPSLSSVGDLLRTNRLFAPAIQILGRPWRELQTEARRSTALAARAYLREAGEPVPDVSFESLILAGHQPELFHPGVWIKNFALYRLARAHGATPINLVVDNDAVKSTTIRVLDLRDADAPHLVSIPFDHRAGDVPYEEYAVQDEKAFADLPQRARPFCQTLGFAPMLDGFWEELQAQAHRTSLLGERLAAGRRNVERRWGCHNLELPVSRLCQTEAYAWFACHIVSALPQFHAYHNKCLLEYRKANHLRSRNHPVPELARDGDWLETPFWGWRAGSRQRGRLFARLGSQKIELRSGSDSWPDLPRHSANPEHLVAAWRGLERQGCKVRSRALMNTLYARLFLADLFIHGIGGAKYDELTDRLAGFFDCRLPRYLVLSATLFLPLPSRAVDPAGWHRLARTIRDLEYNPQRHPEAIQNLDARGQALLGQRQAWVDRLVQTPAEKRQRFESLRQITAQLGPYTDVARHRLKKALRSCEQDLAVREVLERRDYAFCLYPEKLLHDFMNRTSEGIQP